MQRKNIDAAEYADLRGAMTEVSHSDGDISLTMGRHPLHGAVILIATRDAFAVLGNDVGTVVGVGETLESDMAAAA